MAVLPRPPRIPGGPSDKVQHAVAFAALGLLAAFAYPHTSPVLLVILLSAFGALIEVVHLVPALGRDADLRDWVVDTVDCAGAIGGVSVWRAFAGG